MSQHNDEQWWDLQESFTKKCKEANSLAGSVFILKGALESERAKRKKVRHERDEQRCFLRMLREYAEHASSEACCECSPTNAPCSFCQAMDSILDELTDESETSLMLQAKEVVEERDKLQKHVQDLELLAQGILDNPSCTCDEDRHCRELEGCPHCVLMERLKAVLLEKDKNDNGTTSTGSRELDRDLER
jgi:hypothetical protein